MPPSKLWDNLLFVQKAESVLDMFSTLTPEDRDVIKAKWSETHYDTDRKIYVEGDLTDGEVLEYPFDSFKEALSDLQVVATDFVLKRGAFAPKERET